MSERDRQPLRPLEELFAEIEQHIETNAEEIERRIKAAQKRHAIARVEHLKALAETARKGGFGDEAKALWAEITQRGTLTSMRTLEHLAEELRRGGFQRV